MFDLFSDGLFETTSIQIYDIFLKLLLFSLNLLVTELEACNQLVKVGDGHFEVLTFVAFVVSQVIDLIRLLKNRRDFPSTVIACELLDQSASSVSMHARKICRHHVINHADSKVAW